MTHLYLIQIALLCNAPATLLFPKSCHPIQLTALWLLFSSGRAELLEHIQVVNPSQHFHEEGTPVKECE